MTAGIVHHWRRFKHATQLQRLAWLAWIVFLLIVTVTILFGKRQGVYPIFAQGGQCWREGEAVYVKWEGLDRFYYAPVWAVFFSGWSLMPDRLGSLLWRLVSLGFFTLAFTRFKQRLEAKGESYDSGACWLLMLPLLGPSIHNGQLNIVLIGLLLLASAALDERKWWLASSCLVLASLAKIYPVFLALPFVLVFPRQTLWRLMVVGCLGLLLPFAFQGPEYVGQACVDWLHALLNQDRSTYELQNAPRDFYLLFRLAGFPLPLAVYRGIQLLTMLGTLALCVQVMRRRSEEAMLQVLVLACSWMLAFGPATESCTFALLAPGLAFCLLGSRTSNAAWRLLYAMLVLAAISCWFSSGREIGMLVHPLAAFGVFVVSIMQSLKSRDESSAAQFSLAND